ncbi:MAG: aldolase/citrate lyase family protein [Alphaproteobacteria bacterium]|jgi:(S)-citramalyl-CoA lyase
MAVAERNPRSRRSFIFSPGLNPAMFPKALASGADIVCVELEDGVAPKDKEQARTNAIAMFEEPQADTDLVVVDGKLIERPVLRDMYRVLAVAERAR